MTPLEVGMLNDNDKFDNPHRTLSPAPTSFLEVVAPDVIVENWKGAEDGKGTILRLLEVGGRAVTARLRFPLFKLERAWLANAVEEDQSELPVSDSSVEVPLQPHEIATIRILASKRSQ